MLELSSLIFVSSLISIVYNLEPLSMLLFDISIIYENESKVLFVLLVLIFFFFFSFVSKVVYRVLRFTSFFQLALNTLNLSVLLSWFYLGSGYR